MFVVEMRCRQCGWVGDLPGERVPRYGARVRCPRCDASQLVQPGAPARVEGADPERPVRNDPSSGPVAQQPEETGGARPDVAAPAAPVEAATPASGAEPALGQAPEPALAQTAEARKILRLGLDDLRRQSGAPLDVALVFGEHGDELAHLYALWSATYPGEGSRAVFRRELLDALAGLPGNGPPAAR